LIKVPGSVQGWLSCIWLLLLPGLLPAQPGATTANLKKPEKYERRVLASEKSDQGKFNPLKRASQNLNTRYNFYFNADRKLNDVMAGARSRFRDNYAALLPFYNYSLEATAAQRVDLDSILWRCNDAILLHDLRNDWVDDLYLLMGKAYFLRRDFDSAFIAFQFVNYAFQPRKKDEVGYNKFIGSNANESGNVNTISTKEKNNIAYKALGHTPARNESILWLLRTLIQTQRYNEASGLISTLRQDVNFPSRLKPDFYEIQALLYYEQDMYDSAAHYLERSLDQAPDLQARARWEFLLGQMHENTGKTDAAEQWYGKAIVHTTDPILEAYARIYQLRLAGGDDGDRRIDMAIAELMKMVKRDKYEDYKHIIYYGAGKMELQRNNYDAALGYFSQSVRGNTLDPNFKSSVLIEAGDLAYATGRYKRAAGFYDSLNMSDPLVLKNEYVQPRRIILDEMMGWYEVVRVEDSLQRIAAMPQPERDAYVRSQVRRLRKEQGLKDVEALTSSGQPAAGTSAVLRNEIPTDLFASNSSGSGKNDWYFYNAGMKAQGARQFKANFGNRPNVDNWRRAKALSEMAGGATAAQDNNPSGPGMAGNKSMPTVLTEEALRDNLPLSPEKLKRSNDSIEVAYLQTSRILREKIGDCEALVRHNEEFINRFRQSVYLEEALFGLVYCYGKMGNSEKARFYKDYMTTNFSQGRYLRMLNDPRAVAQADKMQKTVATAKYEEVYTKFIEGDFANALAEKKKADSLYGENYWTPQLLYIESIYHIRQKDDSTALATLQQLKSLYPGTPMAAKAVTLMDVLNRRSEIEKYLTDLDVNRAQEERPLVAEEPARPAQTPVVVAAAPKQKDPAKTEPVKAPEGKVDRKPVSPATDSSKIIAPKEETAARGYVFDPAEPQLVVLLLNKVDVVYVNEARNALNRYNRERFAAKNLGAVNDVLDNDRKLIIVSLFNGLPEAREYADKARSAAGGEIFPWMPRDKYVFFVISASNLELLKTRKDINEYLDLSGKNFPVK
jgi:tetratricopeptide (TPR) repeat protein